MMNINQWPLDFSEGHDQRLRTRYVADFEATTYYQTDDPKLNHVSAKNSIDGKEHHYPKSHNQAVNVWLWCIQPIEYQLETTPTGHRYKSVDTSDKMVVGYTIESFIDYIKENCKYADIYFHNGANYDSRFIWDYCTNNGFVTIKQGTSFGGNPNFIIGDYRKYSIWFDNQNVINFRDSRDMYKMGIRDMGNILQQLGYEHDSKGDTPLINNDDYVELEQKYPDHSWVKQAWVDYCKTDVTILHDFITLEHSIDTSVSTDDSLKRDIQQYYPDGNIPLSFNYPPLVESGTPTAASLAYATMMNRGKPMTTYLQPFFRPVASPKHEQPVKTDKGNLKALRTWKKVTKTFSETVIEPILSDTQLAKLQAKYPNGRPIMELPESSGIDLSSIPDFKQPLADDSKVIKVPGWEYTKKTPYTIYQAVWANATTDDLINADKFDDLRAEQNQLANDQVDDQLVNVADKYSKLNKDLVKANHVTTEDLPTDSQAVSTTASHGSKKRLAEIDTDIQQTQSDTYAQRKRNRKIIEDYQRRVRFANDIAKQAYKGGITQTNFQHANKFIESTDGSIIGQEFDVNSLYPSIYANVPFREYDQSAFTDYAMPGDVVVKHFTRDQITKRRLQYYMNNIDKKPTFIKCSFIKATVKRGRMPLIKPRTDDFVKATYPINGRQSTADVRQYYYYKIRLFEQMLAMPDFKYLWNNYDFNYPQDIQVTDIYVFDRFTALEEVMQQHEARWKLVKRFAKSIKLAGLVSYAKLMLNSCYGKMGNYNKSYNNQIILPEQQTTKAHTLNKTKGGNNLAYVPAAAYITSYGRTFLAETVNKIGYDKFLYSDTDSIYVLTKEIPTAISQYIDDTKIGYWAHEKDFTQFKAIKAKCYGYYGGDPSQPDTWKWHSVVAGFNKDSINKDQFNIGTKCPVSRTMNTKGGSLIMQLYQTIQPINPDYASLSHAYFN